MGERAVAAQPHPKVSRSAAQLLSVGRRAQIKSKVNIKCPRQQIPLSVENDIPNTDIG